MKVWADHQFTSSGELEFYFDCPDCETEVILTNPFVEVECKCGRKWHLLAHGVSQDKDKT